MKKVIMYFNRGIVSYFEKFVTFCLVFMMLACGGDGDDIPDPEPIVNDPKAVTLLFPQSNSECTEGSNLTSTESTITFKWNSAMYTDSYSLQLKNISSGKITTYTSTSTSLPLKLERGTPYSWLIISKSNFTSVTAKSDTWKFYNAGAGNASYAPFPAELVSPTLGSEVEGTTVNLDWSGSDIDNDIKSYDIYFGESNTPDLYSSEIDESILNNVAITSGKTYYWKVISKDETGNVSISDVFNFKVK